ncbi:fluoride efflux transporter CrcB [Aliifodinibius sp. S!AR15-10]|uniref:fluoride efflux transporter CrcB n=1 Tax=Aliifodinibius sp. S!AR15-10 TaxID=2950437 RepID=UPI0028655C01|nr:fluoride efflux transporter CrcB [Aliifodinibius sp. S!AR15-10]MDR8394211.1 fluoride efflux transporter CrcB [Aliifodinibius sp. S!AR15-10]
MYKLLLVGVGGFVGACLRYLMDEATYLFISKEAFPAGTVVVNVIGCFLIGYIVSLLEVKHLFSVELRLLVLTGFLGAFTTYSSFALDSFVLMSRPGLWKPALYLALQLLIGIGAVWAGMFINGWGTKPM